MLCTFGEYYVTRWTCLSKSRKTPNYGYYCKFWLRFYQFTVYGLSKSSPKGDNSEHNPSVLLWERTNIGLACCSIPLYLPKKINLKWILLFKDEECDFCWTRTFKLKYMLTTHGLQSLCEFWFYIYIFECCIAWLFPVNKTILPFNNLIQLRQLPNN